MNRLALVCIALVMALPTAFADDVEDLATHQESAVIDLDFGDLESLTIDADGRVLVVAENGELLLMRAQREAPEEIDRLRVWDDAEVWSHPALVGGRLYIRSHRELACLLLE